MKRTSGTYNRADPTAWVKWENKWLLLHDVTWGIQATIRVRGRRFSWYEETIFAPSKRKFWTPATWLYRFLEERHYQAERQYDEDPMGDYYAGDEA